MFTGVNPASIRRSMRRAWTLIELLALIFLIVVTAGVGKFVATKFGTWPGIGAGILAAVVSVIIVVLFYRWTWSRDRRRLEELREKYRTIYRVIAIPSDQKSIIKPEGAEIKIGDYGWEAGPIRKDGLIYLQGLTIQWTVVWHAGFRADQIEKVAIKPSSQYDYWVPYWVKPRPTPPCPFPVLERDTLTMGLPHHSHRYFVNPIQYRANRVGKSDN
jgi:membrane protein implicated in regulation of membrane protease activity